MDFNDIRTTLQALIAIYDNANSLHTNAYDEAVTTPTEESVRRALAIQLIINREWGLAMNENPLQGSFIIDELTDLVEEAVLAEFDRDQRARRRARRDGDRLPARPDPGRVDALRAPQARRHRCRSSASTPSASPTPTTHARATSSWPAPPRPRSSPSSPACATSRPPTRAEAHEALARAQGGGRQRRQRLRRPDGRRARLLAPAGHRGVLRGRRPVPPQRLTRRAVRVLARPCRAFLRSPEVCGWVPRSAEYVRNLPTCRADGPPGRAFLRCRVVRYLRMARCRAAPGWSSVVAALQRVSPRPPRRRDGVDAGA